MYEMKSPFSLVQRWQCLIQIYVKVFQVWKMGFYYFFFLRWGPCHVRYKRHMLIRVENNTSKILLTEILRFY